MYQVRRTETRVNDSNVVEENQVQYGSEISWKKKRMEVWRVILIVRIKKDGSNLEPRVEDS